MATTLLGLLQHVSTQTLHLSGRRANFLKTVSGFLSTLVNYWICDAALSSGSVCRPPVLARRGIAPPVNSLFIALSSGDFPGGCFITQFVSAVKEVLDSSGIRHGLFNHTVPYGYPIRNTQLASLAIYVMWFDHLISGFAGC